MRLHLVIARIRDEFYRQLELDGVIEPQRGRQMKQLNYAIADALSKELEDHELHCYRLKVEETK